MNPLPPILITFVVFYFGYRFYSRRIERMAWFKRGMERDLACVRIRKSVDCSAGINCYYKLAFIEKEKDYIYAITDTFYVSDNYRGLGFKDNRIYRKERNCALGYFGSASGSRDFCFGGSGF